MPRVDEIEQRRDEPRRAGVVAAVHAAEQVVEEPHIAREQPQVAEREQKLGIVRFDRVELRDFTDVLPDRELDVPERLQERVDEPLGAGVNRPVEHDQQIDVGVERERAPPVPADRADDHGPLDVASGLDERPHHLVHVRRIAPLDDPATAPGARRGRVLGAGGGQTVGQMASSNFRRHGRPSGRVGRRRAVERNRHREGFDGRRHVNLIRATYRRPTPFA